MVSLFFSHHSNIPPLPVPEGEDRQTLSLPHRGAGKVPIEVQNE